MRSAIWRLAIAVTTGSVLSGCVSAQATLPVVRGANSVVDVKMLRPGLRVRACRVWVLGIPLNRASESMDDLVGSLLGRDSEADVLTNVHVDMSGVLTGVFNRVCVDVTGDLGREISVVRLPAVGGGHEHH